MWLGLRQRGGGGEGRWLQSCVYTWDWTTEGLVLVSLGSSLLVLADSCSQGPTSALSRCSHLLLYSSLQPGCRRLRNPAGVWVCKPGHSGLSFLLSCQINKTMGKQVKKGLERQRVSALASVRQVKSPSVKQNLFPLPFKMWRTGVPQLWVPRSQPAAFSSARAPKTLLVFTLDSRCQEDQEKETAKAHWNRCSMKARIFILYSKHLC